MAFAQVFLKRQRKNWDSLYHFPRRIPCHRKWTEFRVLIANFFGNLHNRIYSSELSKNAADISLFLGSSLHSVEENTVGRDPAKLLDIRQITSMNLSFLLCHWLKNQWVYLLVFSCFLPSHRWFLLTPWPFYLVDSLASTTH